MSNAVRSTGKDTAGEGIVAFLLRLRTHGIADSRLLTAIEATPHENFVPVEYFENAWRETMLPIACGQTMPTPDISARMIAALMVEPTHNVLEIGTGSGFQTAIVARLAKKVHTMDRYQTLLDNASEKLRYLGINNVTYSKADGASCGQGTALYDRIIADVCYESAPRDLLDALVSGGVVITAIGEKGNEQTIVRLTKIGNRFERENLFSARLSMIDTGTSDAL